MKGMLKENSLENKVILVTGGGSGLGKSMVKYFIELGANVIITSRREELLIEVAKEFNCPAGYHLVEPDLNELKRLIKEKYSMIAFSVDFRMLDTVAQGPFKG